MEHDEAMARESELGVDSVDAEFARAMAAQSRDDALDVVDEAEFAKAMAAKAKGNAAFSAGQLSESSACYDEAVRCFGGRAGSETQRMEKVKLLSNRAECALGMEQWRDAEGFASEALRLDPHHAKSLMRRAKARISLHGGLERHLKLALVDLETIVDEGGDGVAAAASLHRQAKERLKAARKKAAAGSVAAASSSVGEGAGSSSAAPPAGEPHVIGEDAKFELQRKPPIETAGQLEHGGAPVRRDG